MNKHYIPLLKLGGPIIVGQLGMIIQGIADSVMIGHYGSPSLSAAGFINHIMNLAIIFGMGFSYGLTPVIGRLFGNREYKGMATTLKSGIYANISVAILTVASLSILYFNIERLGQPEELIPLMKPYFLTLVISVPFMQLFYAYKQFADGTTDTRTPMWIMLGGNIVNIAGNYILIFGKCGAPGLGLLGAGISTLFSRILMWLSLRTIVSGSGRYTALFRTSGKIRFSLKDFKLLNRLGWPIALQMGMETAAFSLSALMMGWIGATALAANQILCSVSTLCFMVYYGLGAAVTIRESHFHGQNDIRNVRNTAFAGFHLILIFAALMSLLIFLFRKNIGELFTDDGEILELVAVLIIPFLAYQLGDGLQCCFANALRGIEDVGIMMRYAFIAYILISLPLSYIFAFVFHLGALGIWMGYPFGLTSAGILFLSRFIRQTKKK